MEHKEARCQEGISSGMRQVDVSRAGAVCSLCHVPTLVKQPRVSPIPLHMVPGAFGLKEDCTSVAGKDAEGTREMTGCI